MPTLELNNIQRKFDQSIVLKNINLQLNEGERALITGRNGAGKTTLGKIISGILTPSNGEMLWNGKNVFSKQFKDKKDFAWVGPGDRGLFPRLTGQENIDLFGDFLATPTNKRSSLISFWKHNDIIQKVLKTPFYLSSTGMKQLLKIMILGLYSPQLIVLDESLKSLDYKTREDVLKFLDNYIIPKNILLISHMDPNSLNHFCNSTYRIEEGALS